MKKTLSFFIISALLLALAACGGKPAGVKERLAAGEEIRAGFSAETAANPLFLSQAEFLRDAFGELGVRLDCVFSEGDDLVMSEQIAAFADAGAELILCAPAHEEAAALALTDAASKGIPVVMMDRKPEYAEYLAGGTWVDWFEAGYEMAKMASAWITEAYPNAGNGEVHAANLTSDRQNIYAEQSAGLMKGLSEDPRINIVYSLSVSQDSEDVGAAVQSALIYDPAVRLFFCFQEPVAVAVSDFVTSEPSLTASEFAAFAVGLPEGGGAEIEKSKVDESVFRGAVAYGVYGAKSHLTASECVFRVARAILFGEAPESPWWVPCDRWAVTGFGYNYLYDSTANDVLAAG